MISLKAWISALRLRTLPLSISGILMGIALAKINGQWDNLIFFGALCATISFQITSNLANDLGDTLKGTDNAERIGPLRGVQSGLISKNAMIGAICVFVMLSFASSFLLLFHCADLLSPYAVTCYAILSLLCVIAAITYTIGKKAYGYHGLGDAMVFVFFGLVGVMGSYGLFGNTLNINTIFASLSIGTWSVGVLNLNNMRDRENDMRCNKNTIAVKLGFEGAKKYHFTLVIIGICSWILLVINSYLENKNILIFLAFLPLILFLNHLQKIKKINLPIAFDPELKVLSLSTFLATLFLFAISFIER